MSVTVTAYGTSFKNLGLALFDFTTQTFKLALTTSGYTPDPDSDEFFDDVTDEITGAGYTAGGETLTSVSWTYDSLNRAGVLGCDSVEWAALTPTFRYAVAYQDSGDPETSLLLCFIDFGSTVDPVGAAFPVNFPSGLYRIHAGLTG